MSELYSKVRQTIQTGDLVAWRITKIKGFFSFLLILYQKIFNARYSHVGVVAKLGDRLFVIEATPPVVRLYPLSLMNDFDLYKLNIEDKSQHLDILFKNIGKPYSLLDFISSHFSFRNTNTEFYCSELAGSFYEEIGFLHDEDAGITPDNLIRTIRKRLEVTPLSVQIDRGNLEGV